MSTRLVVVSAGLSNPSSTRVLADLLTRQAVEALAAHDEVDVEVIELRPLARALADRLVTGFPADELARALDTVRSADALVAVTPVFSASYSGLFKMFFDVMEPGLLEGKPVLMGATAGTARHSLVLEHAMRPLFSYLRAVPVPTAVFAATEDFGSDAAGSLDARAERASRELASMLGATSRLAAEETPRDTFTDPVPFEEMLGRL
ncbi:FMN reductase [Nocardioides jishulii]|uniref:NADPH-dependent FMN reductase n=1 Tax=Nocardioides jishulii TaxID=2575440 RepID=A0A4U2YNT1_9ACTN|nr:FMN reductase [Nocardioides jishulii]QCX27518.1 NADPH-dependent FMN reductase [Nocardioides jishulii]TKI62325.1 NADPH-dependent FMN reductase [Nocardioides jishulii]